MSAARRYLDQIYSLQRLEAIDPGEYARLVGDELPPATTPAEHGVRDAQIVAALDPIDAMIARAMRLRLDHALAADTSIPPPTRTVFATTIVSYAGRLPLLQQRAHDVAARGGAKAPGEVAALVVGAASAVLELREAMRVAVLAMSSTPEQRKEPEPEPEKTLADLIELD